MNFKTLPAILAFSLILTATTLCQNNDPKIVIDKTDHNFGEVKKGENLNHTFVFKNEGKADLLIKNVAPS
jgi:hypothetical protein